MPWNASGVFERLYSWVTDRDNSIPINATRMDDEMDGMTSALNDVVQGNINLKGPSKHVDGTSAAPGITFADDSDTGLFRKASGEIGYSANGVDQGELIGANSSKSLTNKTIDGSTNTLQNIPTSALNDESVTLAKMAHMATNSFLGRDTEGTGDVEVIGPAAARTILNVADGAIANVSEDTTPQLGGNLDAQNNNITNVGDFGDGTTTIDAEYLTNGSAKSWINFDGTGTVSIRDSFNVSSLTDNGSGDYTVNFTNAFADVNHASGGFVGEDGKVASYRNNIGGNAAGSARVAAMNAATLGRQDQSLVTVITHGDLA